MKPIIIGIHGLHNKPSRFQLTRWWKKSILEGLVSVARKRIRFRFVLVYWAHFLYPRPLSRRFRKETHPFYLSEPYQPAHKRGPLKTGFLRKYGLRVTDFLTNLLFLNGRVKSPVNSLWDWLIRRFFKDLDVYYNQPLKRKLRRRIAGKILIREQLLKTLKKHRKRKIMLIAHSMGSIIAYDVLNTLPQDCKVHTFVTIGSPLGFPAIKHQIMLENQGKHKRGHDLYVPDAVQAQWINLSDLRDKVALDYKLKDDFKPNKRGISVTDIAVTNDYEMEGHANPHKSFGYLRTPELAKIILGFLSGRPVEEPDEKEE